MKARNGNAHTETYPEPRGSIAVQSQVRVADLAQLRNHGGAAAQREPEAQRSQEGGKRGQVQLRVPHSAAGEADTDRTAPAFRPRPLTGAVRARAGGRGLDPALAPAAPATGRVPGRPEPAGAAAPALTWRRSPRRSGPAGTETPPQPWRPRGSRHRPPLQGARLDGNGCAAARSDDVEGAPEAA